MTQLDRAAPFTPEQRAWLQEAFGPRSSSDTHDETPLNTAPTGSDAAEVCAQPPPATPHPAHAGSGKRLRHRAARGVVWDTHKEPTPPRAQLGVAPPGRTRTRQPPSQVSFKKIYIYTDIHRICVCSCPNPGSR